MVMDLMSELKKGYSEETATPTASPEAVTRRPMDQRPIAPGPVQNPIAEVLKGFGQAITDLNTRLTAIEEIVGSVENAEKEMPPTPTEMGAEGEEV